MKSILLKSLELIAKASYIYIMIKISLWAYNPGNHWMNQNPLVYLCLYFPIINGYTGVFDTIISLSKSKEE